MRVLVVGGGGREHALAWAMARSPSVDKVFATPGNPGIAQVAECLEPESAGLDSIASLADDLSADLTIVGPEQPLVAGLADILTARGLPVFGPSASAARIEGSKVWAMEVLEACGAPTGRAATFNDSRSAIAALDGFSAPYVIKADGLAAGKGVTVTDQRSEAEEAIRACLDEGRFGVAGAQVQIMEHLAGLELSVFFLCDGARAVPIGSARDHKRIGDGNTGPNTGGMGAFSPVLDADHLMTRITTEIAEPVLAEMARRGAPYRGVLYMGLMLTADGPKVFEFNCRFGDPEAQVLMMRADSDVATALKACADGNLDNAAVRFSDDAAVAVVMASGGYPGDITTGVPIRGVAAADAIPDVSVFHAGTRMDGDTLVTAGGRVLAVTARARTVEAARAAAYEATGLIRFDGMQFRRDIASEDA